MTCYCVFCIYMLLCKRTNIKYDKLSILLIEWTISEHGRPEFVRLLIVVSAK